MSIHIEFFAILSISITFLLLHMCIYRAQYLTMSCFRFFAIKVFENGFLEKLPNMLLMQQNRFFGQQEEFFTDLII